MSLLDLPNEIILLVAESLPHLRDLSAFTRTNQFLHVLLTHILYRTAAKDLRDKYPFSHALEYCTESGFEANFTRLLEWPEGSCVILEDWLRSTTYNPKYVAIAEHIFEPWGTKDWDKPLGEGCSMVLFDPGI